MDALQSLLANRNLDAGIDRVGHNEAFNARIARLQRDLDALRESVGAVDGRGLLESGSFTSKPPVESLASLLPGSADDRFTAEGSLSRLLGQLESMVQLTRSTDFIAY